MNTSKIIKAYIGAGTYSTTEPITQGDYGYILQIEGAVLPATYRVDFANDRHDGEALTVYGNEDGAEVPEELIATGKDIFAFYYYIEEGFGKTAYTWKIPNDTRAKYGDRTPTPTQQDSIDQLIVRSNEAVEIAERKAEEASTSAQSASDSAIEASRSESRAQTHALNAERSSTNADLSANDASESAEAAARSANQAAQIKADVESLVEDARAAANSSEISARASGESALSASNSALSSGEYASNALGYAESASESAQTASAKASEASTSASTASAKAIESAQSASQALTYKTDAESAKVASQTAQGLAESARDSAISAKTDAESARDDAETARDEAQQAVASISGALAEKAPVITDTASGAIASFSDGADNLPLKSLVVDINPVQDLHGQNAPYPAGGGKNLFGLEKWLSDNGVEYTKSGNSYTFQVIVGLFTRPFVFSETDTEVTLSFESFSNGTSVSARITLLDSSNSAVRTVYADTTTVKITGTACKVRMDWQTGGAGTVTIKAPQIELGSTATDYAPYENICPISGWTEVGVQRTGVNVLGGLHLAQSIYNVAYKPQIDTENHTITFTRGNQQEDGSYRGIIFDKFKPDKQYTFIFSASQNAAGTNNCIRVVYSDGAVNAIAINGTNKTIYTLTTPVGKSVTCIELNYYAQTSTILHYDECGIFEGNVSADDFEPYSGQSITIALGQTVYGGKVDVLSGELVIDRAMVDLGTLGFAFSPSANRAFVSVSDVRQKTSWNTHIGLCSIYSEGLIGNNSGDSAGFGFYLTTLFVRDSRFTSGITTAQIQSLLSGQTLVYELAEPIIIQLTPQQVNSLLGVNNIFADTGDTEVEYRADTKLYIEKLTQPEEDDMIADSAITSGKFFMVGNTLYRALANIASGATITVGTNAQRVSLSDALNLVNT